MKGFWHLQTLQSKASDVHLPASDQEEEGEDDQEGEASHGCRDDDQDLALVRGDVWRWGIVRGTEMKKRTGY